jgi:alpha-beta hydrolase superfamily lysophospholipase
MQTVQNISYLPENCSAPVGPQPPAGLLSSFGPLVYESGTGPLETYTQVEGRLADWLRQAAQLQDPLEVLKQAAVSFYCTGRITRTPPDTLAGATALTDLAVTGHTNHAQFRAAAPRDSDLLPDVQKRIAALDPAPDQSRISTSVGTALDRAYLVAWALRDPNPQSRAVYRAELSPAWVAVSGEDDSPDRPVNVASAPFPQFDIAVTCQNVTLRTRYIIALPNPVYPPTTPPGPPLRQPPPIWTPSIPADHQVILFIHGLDSRCEEASDLINGSLDPPGPGLLTEALQAAVKKCAVIAFDLPTSGYSEMIDHTMIAPSSATQFDGNPATSSPATYPLLDFVTEFVISFVNTIDQQLNIKNRIAAVIGGSLGGNLSLRLAERGDQPWVSHVVAWSPASVWTTFNHDLIKVIALQTCQSYMEEDEAGGGALPTRGRFFYEAFDSPILSVLKLITGIGSSTGPTQPQQWYRDDWSCKGFYIADDRHERQEIYTPALRRWHWRLGMEQLLFSHWSNNTPDGRPWYALINTPTLLAAGDADNYPYAQIYDNCGHLALAATGGIASYYLPLADTGHSIHNERPALLSHYIALFLTGGLAPKEPPASTGPSTGPPMTRPAQTGTGTGVTGPAP